MFAPISYRWSGRARRGSPGFAVTTALLLILAGFNASAEEPSSDPHALLQAMSVAMRSQDYQGSFVYQHSGRVDTLRVFHAGGSSERERLVSLNGQRSELIRNGSQVTCIQPNGTAIVYTSTARRGLLPLVPEAAANSLGNNYQIAVVGSDRVAGFVTDIVDVVPRDGFRYGYRLWLERDSRILVRSIVTDAERKPLEQLMFVSLEIGKPPSETDLLPSQSDRITTTSAEGHEVVLRGEPAWRVENPPNGFDYVSARRNQNASPGAEHLVYSDGLAKVSIYIEPRGDDLGTTETMAGRGTLNIYTHVENEWRITVLGDVPIATVTAMGRSLRRNEPNP
jgi:sigma-E factor negative regulatory protein RseB